VLETAFLHELRRLTAERGIALIFDEIQCGLGRLGTLFAYQSFDVVPDMITLAKPLAEDFPWARFSSPLKSGRQSRPAIMGRPLEVDLSCPALRWRWYVVFPIRACGAVRENGAWLGDTLRGIARRKRKVSRHPWTGIHVGLDVVEKASAVIERGWDAGAACNQRGRPHIRLLPPLVMTREDWEREPACSSRF
jgi:acetylornithine/succinyldiaminopimelate/putrescine aminotransferase